MEWQRGRQFLAVLTLVLLSNLPGFNFVLNNTQRLFLCVPKGMFFTNEMTLKTLLWSDKWSVASVLYWIFWNEFHYGLLIAEILYSIFKDVRTIWIPGLGISNSSEYKILLFINLWLICIRENICFILSLKTQNL